MKLFGNDETRILKILSCFKTNGFENEINYYLILWSSDDQFTPIGYMSAGIVLNVTLWGCKYRQKHNHRAPISINWLITCCLISSVRAIFMMRTILQTIYWYWFCTVQFFSKYLIALKLTEIFSVYSIP